jgi:hypothetical protein
VHEDGFAATPPAGALAVSQGADGSMMAEFGQDATASALQARETAQVLAQYHRALIRPRSWQAVRDRVLREAKDPTFADEAHYGFEVGGKLVEGISIAGAQALRRLAGNMRSAAKCIYDGPTSMTFLIETTDLETNATDSEEVTVPKFVERRRLKKDEVAVRTRTNHLGETLYYVQASDRDTWGAVHTALSKVKRNQVLAFTPPDIRAEFLAACKASVDADTKANPIKARNAVFDAFAQLGVKAEELERFLGHEANLMTPDEVTKLRGLHGAIKKGERTWAEFVEAKEAGKELKVTQPKPKGAVPPPDPKATANGKPTEAPLAPREEMVAAVKEVMGDLLTQPEPGRAADAGPTPQSSPQAGDEDKLQAELERLSKGLEEAGSQGRQQLVTWMVGQRAALDLLPAQDSEKLRARYAELKKKAIK